MEDLPGVVGFVCIVSLDCSSLALPLWVVRLLSDWFRRRLASVRLFVSFPSL